MNPTQPRWEQILREAGAKETEIGMARTAILADRAHLVEEIDELNFQNDTPAFQVLRVIKALLRKTP